MELLYFVTSNYLLYKSPGLNIVHKEQKTTTPDFLARMLSPDAQLLCIEYVYSSPSSSFLPPPLPWKRIPPYVPGTGTCTASTSMNVVSECWGQTSVCPTPRC